MSSDVEMSDCDSLASDTAINIDPEVAAAYSRRPDYVVHKGKTYQWQQHTDHTRAFCKPSVIWDLGDEYGRMENSRQRRFWRCGICKKNTLLACENSSSSGLRHLKKKHKIDKNGQRIITSQKTITSAFAVTATTVTTLVTKFNANRFRYLFIRWIVTMHIAFTCVESETFRDWVLYVAPGLEKYLVRCGDTIRDWIIKEFDKSRLQIKSELVTAQSRIHISFNL
jgi:hypothetical protein